MDVLHEMSRAYYKAYPILTPNYLTRSDWEKGRCFHIHLIRIFHLCDA